MKKFSPAKFSTMKNKICDTCKQFTKQALVFLLLLNVYIRSSAQDANNDGILYISPGTVLSSQGAFINNSSASLENNGLMHIKGYLTNYQSSMPAGSGTLYLNGPALQSVNGPEPFKTYHLVTDNAAGISLNNNLSISGAHTFTNGIINTSATPNYLIYEDGSSYSGDNDNRHVNGWIKKLGSTNFAFPLGNGTFERTASLIDLSGIGEFNMKYAAATPNRNALQIPLAAVDTSEYWIVNKVSGGSASLALNWDNNKVPFPQWLLPSVRVAYYNGINWSSIDGLATGDPLTTGAITSVSISSFNYFTFGEIPIILLPLQIVNFSGYLQNNIAHLSWKVENEQQVDYYQIERSFNGVQFDSIGSVNAANRNSISYSFNDDLASKVWTNVYYRIRQKNKSGNVYVTGIVQFKNSQKIINTLTVFPNPVTDRVILKLNSLAKEMAEVSILDASAKTVFKRNYTIETGSNTIVISDVAGLPAGIYLINVKTAGEAYSIKFIKQ